MLNIVEIFEKLSAKMGELTLYQRAMRKIAEEELKELAEYSKTWEDNPAIRDLPRSIDNMIFYAAKDGRARVYGHKISSTEDQMRSVLLHKNKQYQWLLAEAYEAYEDFVEQSYAYVGFIDNACWPKGDHGNLSVADLGTKDYAYFLQRAYIKKDKPHSMLSFFRRLFVEYEQLEVNNQLKKNLKVMVCAAEKLRHYIVHAGGTVSDKARFVEETLKRAGVYNNGKYDSNISAYLEGFFGGGAYANTIMLVELGIPTEFPFHVAINRFEVLTQNLMSDAHILAEEILKREIQLEVTVGST